MSNLSSSKRFNVEEINEFETTVKEAINDLSYTSGTKLNYDGQNVMVLRFATPLHCGSCDGTCFCNACFDLLGKIGSMIKEKLEEKGWPKIMVDICSGDVALIR